MKLVCYGHDKLSYTQIYCAILNKKSYDNLDYLIN